MKKYSEKHRKASEAPEQTNGRKKRRLPRVLFSGVLVFLSLSLILGALTASAAALYVESHPERFKVELSLFSLPQSGGETELYCFPEGISAPVPRLDDTRLFETLHGSETFSFVPLSEIPTELQNAFVAIEDKRFYTHRGVDYKRTAAAILNYFLSHDNSFGGSTITQQLIKNVTGESAKTPMRKISEIFRALDLEKHLEKSEILERYLNVINLANGCRGVGSASALYFGKTPSELTLAECASIAAITQNPTRYDPLRHPDSNQKRRDNILHEMLLQNYISEEAYREATESPVVTRPLEESDETEKETVHSWYTDLVIDNVIDDLTRQYGYTREKASELLYYGGLRIYTCIDPALQEVLEAYYRDTSHFPRLENGKSPESAMIVLDPETGNILAVAGAIGEKSGNRIYNFATDAKRPPGSVLKPLSVYAPALEYGLANYASVYDDVPVTVRKSESGTVTLWPHNASGVYRGLSSVDYAVSHSLNTVAVRVLEEVGLDRSFDYLKNTLGITSLVDGENGRTDRGLAALALGQMNYGATLREVTAAYTAFANGGIFRSARSYALVTDKDGRILLENAPIARAALSEGNAELMTKLLENVTKSGTARALTLADTVAAAGKTGTTQYSFDRWFVGYTPSLLAGVWYGCEYPETLSGLEGNPALSVWDDVMRAFYEKGSPSVDARKTQFSYSHLRAVRVCADSGKLVSDACTLDPRGDRSTVAYFTESTVPHEFCTCHVAVPYCGTGETRTDGVCLDLGDPSADRTVGLLRVNRSFIADVFVTDAQYTAAPTGTVLLPSNDPRLAYYANTLKESTYAGRSYAALPFNRPCTKKHRENAVS